jgi:hypothetical protein
MNEVKGHLQHLLYHVVSYVSNYIICVSDNRVLKRTFGLKRDEVTREWRKLHNEEL